MSAHPFHNKRHVHKPSFSSRVTVDSSFLHAAVIMQEKFWFNDNGYGILISKLNQRSLFALRERLFCESEKYFWLCPSTEEQEVFLSKFYSFKQKEKQKVLGCEHCQNIIRGTDCSLLPVYSNVVKFNMVNVSFKKIKMESNLWLAHTPLINQIDFLLEKL